MWLNTQEGWTEADHNKFVAETRHLKDELDSEIIDPRMPYAKQAETVRLSLTEAFGEYAQSIRLTNAFFFELEFFMKRMKELKEYTGPKEWKEYDEVMEGAISGGNAIKGVIIDYGMEARNKMKTDLLTEWKTEEETKKTMKAKSDKFLSLLREHIQYEQK